MGKNKTIRVICHLLHNFRSWIFSHGGPLEMCICMSQHAVVVQYTKQFLLASRKYGCIYQNIYPMLIFGTSQAVIL